MEHDPSFVPERLQICDEEAWLRELEGCVEKFRGYAVVLSQRCHGRCSADDLLQEAARRTLGILRATGFQKNLWAAFRRVLRNYALDVMKKKMSIPSSSSPVLGWIACERLESNPEEQVLREEVRALVRRCLATLPERDQEILRLRFFQELSYGDIARHYGEKPSKGAEARYAMRMIRALSRLRVLLPSEWGIYS